MQLHRSAFIKALREELPAVEPWLARNRLNLTFEMMRFRHFTEDAIARGDLATVKRCFHLLHRAFVTGNRHLRTSIVASFLEHIKFTGSNGAAAEKLLSSELAAERNQVLAEWKQLEQRAVKRKRSKGAGP